jgi:pimeloyl-ACP methyl ester carboxylesterase
MALYVFVHGSFQASWCWRNIVPQLEARGHRCITLDLPGHGDSPTPLEDVTFRDYVDAVVRVIEPLSEAPILVGHSMTSIISQVAETVPSRIRALVYVAGILLPTGKAMLDAVNEFDPEYLSRIVWAPDRRTVSWSPDTARTFAYPLCPPDVVTQVLPLLTAEPVAPYETLLELTSANFGCIPRCYVECTCDRIIPIALQRKMCASVPCNHVFSINSDHSPFFSHLTELVSILTRIAELIR